MSYDNLFHGNTDTPNHSQWKIKAESLLPDRDVFHTTATKKFPLGARADSRDGKRWRYCENGAGALTKGYVNQSAVGSSDWQNQEQTYGVAAAIGDKILNLNMTATVAKDAFVDGYLTIEDGTGDHEMYSVKSNSVGVADDTSGYDFTVEIADAGGIRTATATTSEVTLTLNKYKDTIVFPTDPTGVCTGVNNVAVAANYFFWSQVKGPCACVPDTTAANVVGDMVAAAPNTAGLVGLMDIAADGDVLVGYVMRAGAHATSETTLVDLMLE